MMTADEVAQDMRVVRRALEHARVYAAAEDQADAARAISGRLTYSPLRTLLEQAEKAADRVLQYLDQPPAPQVWRDGGPL